MKFFNGLKYYSFYPLATWTMPIHCENCHYEGKCSVDKADFSFFVLATVLSAATLFTFYNYLHSRNLLLTGSLVVAGAYWVTFYRAHKYPCPECKGCFGTPLKFHQLLKNQG